MFMDALDDPARVAECLRALGQVTRLRLVVLLGERAATAAELAGQLGQSHANVTRHLQTLYSLGLTNRELRGGTFTYFLADQACLMLLREIAGRLLPGGHEHGIAPPPGSVYA